MIQDPTIALLANAREHFAVPEATSLAEVRSLLKALGGTELPLGRFAADVIDEFVDESLAVDLFTIFDRELLEAKATPEERVHFVDDEDSFDPLEYGPDQAEWTTISHEVGTLQRALIVLERTASDPSEVGNFRVYGGAQWLRETLWAATGIVPRDPGAPDASSGFFGEAFKLAERGHFFAAPIVE